MGKSSKKAATPAVSSTAFEIGIEIGTQPSPVPIATEQSAGNNVAQLVEQFIRARRLTYSQYQTLFKMVMADGTVDEEERCQINRLFDAIQSGVIRIEEEI